MFLKKTAAGFAITIVVIDTYGLLISYGIASTTPETEHIRKDAMAMAP